MASIKVVLRKKSHTNKKTQEVTFTYHLALRIIKNRKPSFIFLGQTLDGPHQWNEEAQTVKKSHPNSVRLNALILAKRTESTDTAIDLEIKKKDHSAAAIKSKIKPMVGATFFAQAHAYLELFRLAGNYNRVTSEQPRINHFKEYLKGQDISFPEITITLLKHYQAWLKATRKVIKDGEEKPISERTIVNHLLIIRTIYNQAIKAKVTDGENYPFGKDKIAIKFPSSNKIGLNSEEGKQLEQLASSLSDVKDLSLGRNPKPKEAANDNELADMEETQNKLEELDLSDQPYLRHALNVWLFSFYFAGMRVSDVLRAKWADFQNDRNYYSMGKNNKSGSLKIPEKVFKIIEQYKDHEQKHDLIFPELKVLDNLNSKFDVQRKIAYANKRLNKALGILSKQIGLNKKLTMHIARHTFGHLAGDKISVQTLQKLYRHSSITTTIGYQANFIHKDEDTALDSVINF